MSLSETDLAELRSLRDEIYRAAALCLALGAAMKGASVGGGLPELAATVEEALDDIGERLHVLTLPQRERRAAA